MGLGVRAPFGRRVNDGLMTVSQGFDDRRINGAVVRAGRQVEANRARLEEPLPLLGEVFGNINRGDTRTDAAEELLGETDVARSRLQGAPF